MARISQNSQSQLQVEDGFLIALAKQGNPDAYDRLVRRYYGFVRLKASSYFLAGGDSDDLIQEGLVGLYKAIRDYRTDRESSFRNFAELCITRQIITAVKTATRNKHTPLNQYLSFSSSPSSAAGEGEPTLDEVIPGPSVHDPVNQVISSEELQRARRVPLDRAVRARVARAVALPRRPLLRGRRQAARLRHEDGRQRAPARQAQGRHAPRRPQRAALGRLRPCRTRISAVSVVLVVVLVVLGVLLLLAILGAAMAVAPQRARRDRASSRASRAVDRQLAAAVAADHGWERGALEADRARSAFAEHRPGRAIAELELVQIVDEPGTDQDLAVFLVAAADGAGAG